MAGLLTSGFYSLFSKFNKTKGRDDGEKEEGLIESLGELTLDKDDEDLIILTKSWELLYAGSATKKRIHDDGDISERYWLGKQFPDSEYENGKRPLMDNVIFEGFETMIPQATQQNPDPIVLTDDSIIVPFRPMIPPTPPTPAIFPNAQLPNGAPANPGSPGSPEVEEVTMRDIGDKINMSLKYLAQYNNLKTKLKKGVRHWGIRFLGAWQVGYDGQENEIDLKALNPKDLILDPNGYIEDGEYHGEFLGLRLYDTARNLITRFPEHEDAIKKEAAGKLGSLLGYVQWWTDEFVLCQMKDIILMKSKNPNWNYDKHVMTIGPTGLPTPQTIPGHNHFHRPKMPFFFVTVFDLGDEPCDKTSLIQQGLVTQDNINKRLKQIDRNTDNINGGIVVNGLMFNKEQSAQVAEARRQGRTIVTPGKPEDAIMFPTNAELPAALYDSLNDQRSRFLSRFGVAASTAEGSAQEETVRGKIIAGQTDTSRTGGGITEYLELAAARCFNHWLQFIMVYWDQPHWVSVIGPNNAMQVIKFQASDIPPGRQITVTVQNGSMVPQDELSIYNEAMGEWEAGILDPLSYFEKTKDSNPQERATKLMMFKTNPTGYMQEFLQMAPPPMAAPPPGQPVSTSGAPPIAVTPPKPQPSPQQVESNQLIKSVPLPK